MGPGMTNYSGTDLGECTCFISALRASEQLHQTFAKIETQPLDQVFITTRQAVSIVQQYSTCPLCTDSSRFPFYALLLQQVTECYPALLQRGNSTQEETNTIRLQVGTFSVDAPIETAVQAAVFSEVQRTTDAISKLGDVLQRDGVKSARETWDEATCAYQSSLVKALKNATLKIRDNGHDTGGN
jgi:hypothetical protein